MGKTVFFIRHAKSSWNDPTLRDSQRPLNHRGLRNAPQMAAILKEKIGNVDGLISSPAIRAFTTASYFANAFQIPAADIKREPRIYEAFSGTLINLVRETRPDWDTVLFFGHNPGFTAVANEFSSSYIDNVPTCGIVEIHLDADDWAQFGKAETKVLNFYYPKQFPK